MADQVVRLTFPARAEYLLLARLTLSGLARELPLGDELLADLKLAVTEACGNAVRHAYPGAAGDVSLVFAIDDARLQMTVEDYGDGIQAPDALGRRGRGARRAARERHGHADHPRDRRRACGRAGIRTAAGRSFGW